VLRDVLQALDQLLTGHKEERSAAAEWLPPRFLEAFLLAEPTGTAAEHAYSVIAMLVDVQPMIIRDLSRSEFPLRLLDFLSKMPLAAISGVHLMCLYHVTIHSNGTELKVLLEADVIPAVLRLLEYPEPVYLQHLVVILRCVIAEVWRRSDREEYALHNRVCSSMGLHEALMSVVSAYPALFGLRLHISLIFLHLHKFMIIPAHYYPACSFIVEAFHRYPLDIKDDVVAALRFIVIAPGLWFPPFVLSIILSPPSQRTGKSLLLNRLLISC
jgi:hypothetical protein